MSYYAVPVVVKDLLRMKWPDHRIARVEWHSEHCVTIHAVSQDHHAVKTRWNLGLSGRWTLIPLSQGVLD